MTPKPDLAGPGQESVWSYPRPPVASASAKHLKIVHRGLVIAESGHSVRTLETSHPPTYYFPPLDVDLSSLRQTERRSVCEWKGEAVYFDVTILGETLAGAAWSYPNPHPDFAALRDYVAFYPAPFDECTVDGERATPQQGGFYGGWITSHVTGPFKGVPGSRLW